MHNNPATVSEVREIARRNFTTNARLYYESGADGEQTLSENCRAYDRLRLCRSLPLSDSELDLSTDLLGKKIDIPICCSPTAMHRMAHDDGEIATARGNIRTFKFERLFFLLLLYFLHTEPMKTLYIIYNTLSSPYDIVSSLVHTYARINLFSCSYDSLCE